MTPTAHVSIPACQVVSSPRSFCERPIRTTTTLMMAALSLLSTDLAQGESIFLYGVKDCWTMHLNVTMTLNSKFCRSSTSLILGGAPCNPQIRNRKMKVRFSARLESAERTFSFLLPPDDLAVWSENGSHFQGMSDSHVVLNLNTVCKNLISSWEDHYISNFKMNTL